MTTYDPRITKSYHQAEIQQILNIAIARQVYNGEFSHKQLLEIATELEILPECLQAAEREWLTQQTHNQKRQEFNRYRRSKLQKRFGNHLIGDAFLSS